MITPANVLATARDLLQDTIAGGYRYSDESLYRGFNQALREARRLRPDLYFWDGRFQPVPTVTAGNATTPIPLDEQFENAFVLFVVGFAELREDQYSQDGRAAGTLTQFKNVLVGM